MELIKHFDFYQSLKPFKEFSGISEDKLYQTIPVDWAIVITDILGSTRAVNEGRYKEVNLIGAATISCFVNLIGTHDLPFVFGGDGATLLVPNAVLPLLLEELLKLKRLAQKQFHLELRIGYVEISTLKALGQEFKVAKYELSPGNFLAQFKGGALSFAENLIKLKDPRVQLLEASEGATDAHLQGLSCRLKPLKSVHGEILTLLCKPLSGKQPEAAIQEVLSQLAAILNDDFNTATPVTTENLNWPIPAAHNDYESQLKTKTLPYFLTWLTTFLYATISNLSLKYGFRIGNFIPANYKEELKLNSDFKKFDETLRMVLDCTPQQIERIKTVLEDLKKQDLISYGMHVSKEALMTCVVLSPTANKHIHFIDGSDGGYTMAAVQMKKQLQSLI